MTLSIRDIAPGIIHDGKSAERGVLIGGVGSGKTTLALEFIESWQLNPVARILLIDTKPCFAPHYEVNGLYADRRYKDYREIHPLEYGYRIPFGTNASGLNDVWKIARTTTPKDRGLIAVAQCQYPEGFWWLDYMVRAFYGAANKKVDSYIYVDEMVALMRNNRKVSTGITQTVVSGRGKGVVFLGAAQRPRWFPVEILSESSKLYLFSMDFEEDMDHLRNMGTPKNLLPPAQDYVFKYFNKRPRVLKTLKLTI